MSIKNFTAKYKLKTTGEFKTIDLTTEQYRRLLLAVSLGLRTIVKDDNDHEANIIDIHQYLMSYAPAFDSKDSVEYDVENDWYFETPKHKETVKDIIDYYEEHVLFCELARRMASKTVDNLEKKGIVLSIEEIEEIELGYFEEFISNGFKKLALSER